MIRLKLPFMFVLSVTVLIACSDNSAGPANGNNGNDTSLLADAGADAEVIVGNVVTADGSASDTGTSADLEWEIQSRPEGSQSSLSDALTETPAFIPDLPGEYSLELTISSGEESSTDTVLFTAIAKRLFVDAEQGADGEADGYLSSVPLKTLTQALDLVWQNGEEPFLDIDTVFVAAGLYDKANGESFPLHFAPGLIVRGDMNEAREDIHILSPDVEGEPATELYEGAQLRHLTIENGYTGGTFNGDPDAVFVNSGTSEETSEVILEDVTLTTNNREGYIISTGSNISLTVRGYEGARSTIDGNTIGFAYTNRFNTSNVNVHIKDTDVINIGDGGAFQVDDVNNLSLTVSNSTIKPSSDKVNDYAFDLEDACDLLLDNTVVTSSDGTESGSRFKMAIIMDNDQPETTIEVSNSTLQYTQWSAIKMYQATVRVENSLIEGVHTQEQDGPNLARNGINHLDGTLIVRETTFRNINSSGIEVGGPLTPNEYDFYVDLGTEDKPGNNVFENVEGWDVAVSRGDNLGDSDGVQTEIPALGNTWSNGVDPRCKSGSNEYDTGEVWVNEQGGSLRWGSDTGEVCL